MRITGSIVLVLALVLAVSAATFGIRWVTAEPKGKLEAREQIKSGASRISGYDHFFDLCGSIQALEGSLSASIDELANTTDPEDQARIRTNITGLTAQRARSIAEYNLDARKSYTLGQFRSSDLPFQLSTTPYTKGAETTCVA